MLSHKRLAQASCENYKKELRYMAWVSSALPGFVLGDPSSARYVFLGVDQHSNHAPTVMAMLEYRF